MKFRYDSDADALYIELTQGQIKESEEVKPGVILDLGQDGNLIGIELLSASKRIGKKLDLVVEL